MPKRTEMNNKRLPEKQKKRLQQRREELVKFAEDFKRQYEINEFSEEELDLWIEHFRPIRLEIRAIDKELARLEAGEVG